MSWASAARRQARYSNRIGLSATIVAGHSTIGQAWDPQPDVREHPRPAAVAIAEWVDLNCSMMDENRLLEDVGQVGLATPNVVAQLGQVFADVAGIAAHRSISPQRLATGCL
jgi:hypothetical protein